MDLTMIAQAAAQTFTLYNIALIFGGLLIGMVIGCIPGLSVTLGIILMLPLTYNMEDAASAIILMLAVYVGGMYGGSISAITLNTPGTNSAIATTFDGYPLARKGKVKKALDVSLFASTFGGLFSALLLMLGLLMACVGKDSVTGVSRYAFGSNVLRYGINILPAMIALIALMQVVDKLREFRLSGGKIKDANKIDNDGMTGKETKSILPACFKSSAIASILGAMPGVGGGVAQFMCYNEVRRSSKHPEEFGKGCLEGIAAAESSNNAVVGSAMIPLLTLGIPGDGVTALLLGAFMLHGITPGPTMFTKQGVMAYTIILGCLVANIFLFPIGKALTRAVAKVIQVRYTYLACAIIMFCFAGAFAASGHVKELILTAAILILSYVLTILDIDNTPLLLGMILEPIMEKYFVSASMAYDRDYSIFIRRPISLVILIITVVMVISMMRVNRRVNALNAEQEAAMAAEHEQMGSAEDAVRASETAKADVDASFEDSIANAVFEKEHITAKPDVKVNLDKDEH